MIAAGFLPYPNEGYDGIIIKKFMVEEPNQIESWYLF